MCCLISGSDFKMPLESFKREENFLFLLSESRILRIVCFVFWLWVFKWTAPLEGKQSVFVSPIFLKRQKKEERRTPSILSARIWYQNK